MRCKFPLLVLLQLILCTTCLAQTDTGEDAAEPEEGRFLLDLNYTAVDSKEGKTDLLTPGFSWLISPSLRAKVSTDLGFFNPAENESGITSSRGMGDTIFSVQYDWQERLTVSPWVPDNIGTSFSILIPTGDAKNFLGMDTWGGSIAFSWPITIEREWLLNPVINYNFTFAEGKLADPTHVGEVGIGVVRLFPRQFWISYTPSLWYDLDFHTWNYDSHITVGKMFSNGMGIGLDYGSLARHFLPGLRDDRSILVNFYYQFCR
jgi:hypothetical protein